mmetsp:Transcript_1939/g.5365  ORF Transcript_1939/g.5365 Transcript_1939/m.5365 type:complete len:149 (-) Transcript_1939:327-773(-)
MRRARTVSHFNLSIPQALLFGIGYVSKDASIILVALHGQLRPFRSCAALMTTDDDSGQLHVPHVALRSVLPSRIRTVSLPYGCPCTERICSTLAQFNGMQNILPSWLSTPPSHLFSPSYGPPMTEMIGSDPSTKVRIRKIPRALSGMA